MNAEESMRAQVRAALKTAGLSQAEVCRQLGLSTKHLNQMLTGVAPLSLSWAERILPLCGMRLVVLALTGPNDPDHVDDCPGFEGNPVAPDLCAGCGEARRWHAAARPAAAANEDGDPTARPTDA